MTDDTLAHHPLAIAVAKAARVSFQIVHRWLRQQPVVPDATERIEAALAADPDLRFRVDELRRRATLGTDLTAPAEDPGGPRVVRFVRLPHGKDLSPPRRMTPGASGFDLFAAIPVGDVAVVSPFRRTIIPTGIALELPAGYEAQLRPRSGMAFEHGVTIANAPGTVDTDFRGEIKVCLVSFGDREVTFKRGDRVAQLVVMPVPEVKFVEVDRLSTTARGEKGYGSTGT